MLGTVSHTSTERIIARETSKLLRLGAPWVWLVASFPVAVAVRALGGGQPLGAAVLTLATVAVTGLTWIVTRGHGPMTCYPAAATAATSGLWLTLSAILGIPAVWRPWLITAVILAISHNIIAIYHRGTAKDSPQKLLGGMLGLPGSRLALAPTPDGTAATGRWELTRGEQTAQDAQSRRGLLASAAGVSPQDVTIDANGDHGVANVRIQLVDVHKNPIPWPGPAHAGGLPTDPIPIGIYRDNTRAELRVITTEHGARHQLTAGVQGSGKTTEARIELCELATRRQTTLIAIDTLKGAQSLACIRDGLDKVIDNQAVAERFISKAPRLIQERSRHLGKLGLDNWAPDCGLNFLNVHIEEAHRLVDTRGLSELAVAFRSVGCRLVLSTQRPVYTQIDTTVRSQLGIRLCFGLNEDGDSPMALGDEAVAAGADPSVWGNNVPGMAYLLHPGIDQAHRYMPLRGYEITAATATAHIREWAPGRDPLDDMAAQLLPEMLGTATVIPVNRPSWPTDNAGAEPIGATHRQTPKTNGHEHDDDEPATPDPAPELIADLNTPLPELPDTPLNKSTQDMATSAASQISAEEARQILIAAVHEAANDPANDGIINPGLLHHVTARAGKSRTWIYEACRALARDRVLTDDPASGGYRLNQPPQSSSWTGESPPTSDPSNGHRHTEPVGASA
jgi:hypothetical protein